MRSLFTKPTYCFAEGSLDLQQLEQNRWKLAPTALGVGVPVASVAELLTKIAQLQNAHPSLRLFFRGQNRDYQIELAMGQKGSFIFPTALRDRCVEKEHIVKFAGQRMPTKDFHKNLKSILKAFELTLKSHHPARPKDQPVTSFEALAILQHYEVMPTTMLDLTSNWRVACNFSRNDGDESFFYVFGIPDFDKPITIDIEAGMAIVDLARVCPPTALRPHFQNGFGMMPYPEPNVVMHPFLERGRPPLDWDLTKRLLGKFRLTDEFWKKENAPVDSLEFYFPDKTDPMFEFANSMRGLVGLEPLPPFQEK